MGKENGGDIVSQEAIAEQTAAPQIRKGADTGKAAKGKSTKGRSPAGGKPRPKAAAEAVMPETGASAEALARAAPDAPDSTESGAVEPGAATPDSTGRAEADAALAPVLDAMWDANPLSKLLPIDWGEVMQALSAVSVASFSDPFHAAASSTQLNLRLWKEATNAWTDTMARWAGTATAGPDEAPGLHPAKAHHHAKSHQAADADRRFEAPEWEQHPFFRLLKQSYLAISEQLLEVGAKQDLPPAERQRLLFHLRQFVDAMSPTLFLPTNPAALRRAVETGGGSIVDGLRNFAADMKEGRLSMTDTQAFAPGKNLALTPGKVVFRNRLIELIQYTPVEAQSHAVPLLIMPPWINKFYILDLQPKNSLVRYLLEQGYSVFMISWKNPDTSMEAMTFEDYMLEGPIAASDVIREITGSATVNPIGYCIGGTLLAMTLAHLSAKGDRRFGPATLMVSMQDFSEVGETAVFMDEPQIAYMERRMLEQGYLDSRDMANMFNLLRSNDLIWNAFVNNYLLGNKPPAFDLLYWNSDGTRMARAAHSFYLRNTYLENNLIKPGKVQILGEPLDLRRIESDIYSVGAEKDHIVPWQSAWRVALVTRAKVRFVLAASGHIAGMINPPAKAKGGYWTSNAETVAASAEEWLAGAEHHQGSWWIDWMQWLSARSGEKVPSPQVGSEAHPPLVDAPGTYVLEK